MNKKNDLEVSAAARHLIRSASMGTLATIMRDADGAPYASLVATATDHGGAPLLLLSDLADHTKNLGADDRVSLLLRGGEQHEDPMAGERLSLQGRLLPADREAARKRYLARHPQAAMYVDFGDFNFYRLAVDKAHLVAGFGRIHWIDGPDLGVEPSEELITAEPGIVDHMNEDHADAVYLYAARLLGRSGDDWRMIGVDTEGVDLRCKEQVARLPFDRPVRNSTDVRKELIILVNRARDA